MTSREAIERACEEMKAMLLAKNEAYGDSAFYPLEYRGRKYTPEEGMNIRIADKVKRLLCGSDCGEDTELDLAGYIILKRALKAMREAKSREDEAEIGESLRTPSRGQCSKCGCAFTDDSMICVTSDDRLFCNQCYSTYRIPNP